MKYLSFLVLFVLCAFQSQAQRNFKPGYIVTLNGDTTKGFVDYREWDQNPRNITFSTTGQPGNATVYTVADIKGFGINNLETYGAYRLSISKNSVETAALSNVMDTTTVTDHVFLRTITAGKNITLFQYTDNFKDHFYVSEGNGNPVELKFYRYLDKQQLNKVITTKTFGQQLQRLVAKYQTGNRTIVEQVQRAEYSLDDLTKIAFAINGEENTQKTSSSDLTATEFFVGIAANATHIGYKSSDVSSKTSVLPQLNAGLNVFLNKNVRKLLFRAELNISGNKADASTVQSVLPGSGLSERLTFDQLTFSFSPQLLYNIYSTEKSKVFVGGGLAFNYSIYSNTKYFIGNTAATAPSFSSTYMSVAFKTGITLKCFEVYAGYNRPLADIVEASIIRNSYQLGINYFFK